jgi:hypothetical protein
MSSLVLCIPGWNLWTEAGVSVKRFFNFKLSGRPVVESLHNDEPFALGVVREASGLAFGVAHGFLEEHMLPSFQCLHTPFKVQTIR